MQAHERLLRYVRIDTQSDPTSMTSPSTEKQKNLGCVLVEELKGLGISNAMMDEYGYVYAVIEGNKVAPSIAFIAHMDTASDCSGANVNPKVVHQYDGKDIVLNDHEVLRIKDFPEMVKYQGKDLIVTDGTTLLGADDKAGIAEIMTMAEYLMQHPEVNHGTIHIVFTPDEEVGRGTEHFDLNRCNCDFGYTVDGGEIECIDYENFNAASAIIDVKGISIHPGSAKNKMINAIQVGMEFHQLLPTQMRPEHTEGYEGFYHLSDMQGDIEHTRMEYIIRNHDFSLFEKQKQIMKDCADFINHRYQKELVKVTIEDSYYNMKEHFKDHMDIIELAKGAIESVGLVAKNTPIRGGTDGAMLTYQGLRCPNLGTGGGNFHGRYEFACIQDMELAVQILLEIVKKAGV
ncbi:MAG: peptidase T [Erysipelotrichaceae bacterium]|nr:peptidase T [Erysipelotrichaceae bacterium]